MIENNGFYKDKYFEEIKEHFRLLREDLFKHIDDEEKTLEKVDSKLACLQKDVSEMKGRFKYMYGFAAGLGIIGSLMINWIKVNIFGLS